MRKTQNDVAEKRIGFFKRFLIALLALVISVAAWCAGVMLDKTMVLKEYKDIPLVFVNEDALHSADLGYIEPSKTTVDVVVKAYFSELVEIDANEIRAEIDLSKQTSAGTVKCIPELKGFGGEVVILKQEEVEFGVQTLIRSSITVDLEMVGKAATNYYVSYSDVKYEKVLNFKCSQEVLSRIAKAKIVLDIEGVSEKINRDIEVVFLDEDGNVIDSSEIYAEKDKIRVEAKVFRYSYS